LGRPLYREISVEEVAEAAGVSKGLLRWRDQAGLEREQLRVLLGTELEGALLAASAANAEARAKSG
jgi:hypothetical protein